MHCLKSSRSVTVNACQCFPFQAIMPFDARKGLLFVWSSSSVFLFSGPCPGAISQMGRQTPLGAQQGPGGRWTGQFCLSLTTCLYRMGCRELASLPRGLAAAGIKLGPAEAQGLSGLRPGTSGHGLTSWVSTVLNQPLPRTRVPGEDHGGEGRGLAQLAWCPW